jgi:hydrogenase/urease accessory protein HupE
MNSERSRRQVADGGSRWFRGLLLITCALLCSFHAQAHTVGISRGVYVVEGREVSVALTFSRGELAAAVPELAFDDANTLDELAPKTRAALSRWSVSGLRLESGALACPAELSRVEEHETDGVTLRLRYRCAELSTFEVKAAFLASLSSKHVHIAHWVLGDVAFDRIARHGAESFRVDVPDNLRLAPVAASTRAPGPAANPGETATRFTAFFRMGLEHILTGYDHLLFLVGLLLVLGPVSSLIWAVSAFTLAHSLTLSFAAMGLLLPSPRLVEPLIAASIAYVGIENWFRQSAVGRWRITFLFGLVHGFGFASVLREISLPRAELPLALLSFNLGVEAGQLAVVALLLPLLLFAHRRGWLSRRRAQLLGLPIAAAGVAWLILRLLPGPG